MENIRAINPVTVPVDEQNIVAFGSTIGQREARRQQWKDSDEKAQKNGNCQAVYWVKQKRDTTELKRKSREDKQWVTGAVYKGEWKDNKKHGYGIQLWSSGNKYEGDWANGFRDGHGIFWVKDGDKLRKVYAGNWKNDLKDGLGVFFSKDKSRYEGNWRNGMRSGQGTLFYPNGDIYVGQWNEDKQSGFGTLTRANQDVYEGEWLNGKREGPGIYYYKTKEKIYDGEWVNDIPKCGVYTAASEFFEEGEMELNADPFETPRFKKKTEPIPRLRLADPDGLLAARIEEIQKERQAVRNLPFIQLERLFSEEGVDDLRRIFSSADAEGAGEVGALALKDLFRELKFNVTDEELAQLLVDIDKTASSTINFSEFVKAAHLIDDLKSMQNKRRSEEAERALGTLPMSQQSEIPPPTASPTTVHVSASTEP